ncbi:MAG TPA: vWA domain-containing protein [Vicinamibacteria bacterium]
MPALAPLLSFALLSVASPSPTKAPAPAAALSPQPAASQPVIIFLVDNSASLPPLDPEAKRVEALEKIFAFLRGQPYRLVLFGGRHEVFVDDVERYRNDGQWTDFYSALVKAREVMSTYPPQTEFRMILLTDALFDPRPEDWSDLGVPEGSDLKAFAIQRTVALVREMQTPLYVILVGELPGGEQLYTAERSPRFILDLVSAANGAQAGPAAQTLASFFDDNGLLLKKFIFRVSPEQGLKRIEPAVRRITTPPRPWVELKLFTYMVLPAVLFLLLLVGIMVRSFPGSGDLEIVELDKDQPAHLAVDRLHKLEAGGWAPSGLSLVAEPRDAAGTLVYQPPPLDLAGAGLDTSGLDGLSQEILPLPLEDLPRRLHHYANEGSKEEKIFALNLEYMAQSFDPKQAERLLCTAPAERGRLSALDFLRAKVHLLSNDTLRAALTEPRVHLTVYGPGGGRKELWPGNRLQLGRYGFVVKGVEKGGRKDARLLLGYDRVPSLLGLKSWLPSWVQRAFRLRRSNQRVVS